jgi:glycosyltransferase involved in cell wall biosynthesis
MKEVYSVTALLMVPSQGEEAFGRVTLEAQINGIPVLGRSIGGLPEVLEPSGILLPPDARARAWADAIEQLLTDKALYALRSAQARDNSARSAFDVNHVLEEFLSVARDITAG